MKLHRGRFRLNIELFQTMAIRESLHLHKRLRIYTTNRKEAQAAAHTSSRPKRMDEKKAREDHSQEEPKPKKHKKLRYIIIGVIILLLLLLLHCCGQKESYGDVLLGEIDWDEPANLQEQVDAAVAAGMTNVFMNTNIYLEDGISKANLLIQNAETNPAPIQVDLIRDDTGETLYESEVIPVGHKIEEGKLLQDLDPGEYGCTAVFSILNPDDASEVINQVKLNVTVTVKN